jgi:hypothetical protein
VVLGSHRKEDSIYKEREREREIDDKKPFTFERI